MEQVKDLLSMYEQWLVKNKYLKYIDGEYTKWE
jgi:hypothetical protein